MLRSKRNPPPAPSDDKAKASAPSGPDERDIAIERLERAIVEERQNSATLRKDNEDLRFKMGILEKSFSKQLSDARVRMQTAEEEVGEHRARLKALGSGGEDSLRLLGETRAELARVNSECEKLKGQLKNSSGRQAAGRAQRSDADYQDSSGTINQLIQISSSPTRERVPTADSNLGAKVRAEQDAAPVDMLAPELVFTAKDKED